jgi:nicotinate-nucleotide pyrophosphorylase (carboxylating)
VNDELSRELAGLGLDPDLVASRVRTALEEDRPDEDVTSVATLDPDQEAWADLVARADGVLAGVPVAELVFRLAVPDVVVERVAADGDRVRRGEVVLSAHGRVVDLLTAERVALNFLCHLSGVATATAQWVDALAGTRARVRDTRKTTPGLRALEKYAVRCGGGVNHRATLSDQALVKDNHVLAAGGVVPAYEAVRARYPDLPVQVEVTTLDQLRELVAAGATSVLLDNMGTDEMAEAVRVAGGRVALEASGGLTLERARAVAETGVDLIAVGAVTHSAPVLDIAMDLRS